MNQKECTTWKSEIFIGLRVGYDGEIHPTHRAKKAVQEYVDRIGLGVTVTETTFIYTGGSEPGLIIGLINYPRFPTDVPRLEETTTKLAQILIKVLQQERCTVTYPDRSILIEK